MPRKTASNAKKAVTPIITQSDTKIAAEGVSGGNIGKPPTLLFAHGGWCDELNDSYMPGYYQPKNWEEYNALKKHAAQEVKHD